MGRPKGYHHSEETKRKMSESQKGLSKLGRPKGYKMSEDAKNRISKANKGRQTRLGYKASDETKHKMSISHIGQNTVSGMKGKHHTEETKRKMSKSHKALNEDNSKNLIPYVKYGYIIILNGKLYDSVSAAARDNGFKSFRALKYLIDNNRELLYRKYGITIDYISDGIVKKNIK